MDKDWEVILVDQKLLVRALTVLQSAPEGAEKKNRHFLLVVLPPSIDGKDDISQRRKSRKYTGG